MAGGPAAGIRLNKPFYDKKGRLQKVPGLMDQVRNVDGRRFAAQYILEYQDGLRRRRLRLKPLAKGTLASKKRMAFRYPRSPLVAMGDEDRDALINAMEIRAVKVKSVGRTVFLIGPSRRLHHRPVEATESGGHRLARAGKKGPPLYKLLAWHERGIVIRNGFGRGIRIVIPPRPAARNAWKVTKAKLSALKRGMQVKMAVGEVVMRGSLRRFKGLWALTSAQKRALRRQGGKK